MRARKEEKGEEVEGLIISSRKGSSRQLKQPRRKGLVGRRLEVIRVDFMRIMRSVIYRCRFFLIALFLFRDIQGRFRGKVVSVLLCINLHFLHYFSSAQEYTFPFTISNNIQMREKMKKM